MKERIEPELLVRCAKHYAQSTDREGTEERFLLHASTFLGPHRRYLDYVEPPPRQPERRSTREPGDDEELDSPGKTSTATPSEGRICTWCGQPYRPFRIGESLLQAPVCDCALERTRQKERQEWQEYRREQRWLQSGLTARLRRATFSSFGVSTDNQTVFQLCRAYAERWPAPVGTGESSGLLLWGIPGVGKTHLAAALANQILERGARVRFCNVTQWLNRLRDECREGEPVEERLDDLGAADLLVLDDLGAQKRTAWALEKIYQVVNQRYEGLQPLVATTNKNLNQLERGVGSRIFGRLLEICIPAEMKGEDWRKKIAKQRQFRGSSE